MAENRVSQLAVQVSASGSAEPTAARVSQVVVQISVATFLKQLTGSSGIASAEALGSGGSVAEPGGVLQTITGSSGVASVEAFGTGAVDFSPQTVTGGFGIASGAALGSGGVIAGPVVGTAGIASTAALGADGGVCGPIAGVAGIVSGEALGVTGGNVSGNSLFGELGIPSGEVFGADGALGSIGGPLDGLTGIASAEAFGSGTIAGPISGSAGIASAEVLGIGSLGQKITGAYGQGILSGEAFGAFGRVVWGLGGLLGIPTSEAFGISGAVLQLSTTASNFAVWLDGANVNNYILADSIQIDEQLNFSSSASFSVIDESSGLTLGIGKEVIIYYYDSATTSWRKVFAGTVESYEVTKTHVLDAERLMDVRCVSYARTLSRRLVNMRFSESEYGTLAKIMTWLQDHYFTAEGLTWVDKGAPSGVIGDLEFNYTPLNEVMNKLSEVTGWDWMVDYDRNVYVYDRPAATTTGIFDITEDTVGANAEKWANLRVQVNRGLFRNKQYIKATYTPTSEGGEDSGGGVDDIPTKTVTETYTCPIVQPSPPNAYAIHWELDSNNKAPFFVDWRYKGNVKKIRSIKFNGSPSSFYVQRGFDTPAPPEESWDWAQVWERDSDLIWNMPRDGYDMTQWPKAGDTLEIEYEVYLTMPPAPSVETNDSSVAQVQTAEGGTGLWEAVEELSGSYSQQFIEDLCASLLARFSVWGAEVTFDTVAFGLLVGQRVYCNLPSYGLAAQNMTVESISYRETQKTVLQASVKISNQIQQRDALASMQRLIQRIRKPVKQVTGVVTWDLAVTYPGVSNPGLSTGTALGNPFVLRNDVSLDSIAVYFKTPPTGQAVQLRIKANGVSITDDDVSFSAGASSVATFTNFKSGYTKLLKGTVLTIDVVQAGSVQAGKDGVVHLAGWI